MGGGEVSSQISAVLKPSPGVGGSCVCLGVLQIGNFALARVAWTSPALGLGDAL